jgi:predicted nucleic acid-binding protein
LLNTTQSETAARVWERLIQEQITPCAPSLWRYEVTSLIHKYLYDGLIDQAEANDALKTAFELSVNLLDGDQALCRAAILWGNRLKLRGGYDGFYLALAENLEAPFWTANQRLTYNAWQIGANWVHWMGEIVRAESL